MDKQQLREHVLYSLGATASEVAELMQYNENVFKKLPITDLVTLPLEDERFVATWQQYALAANETDVFSVLKEKLVQLQFPIQAGISETENYRKATLRGITPVKMEEAIGLQLESPERLQLDIYESLAGRIPLLIVRERNDFVRLVQALTRKNEPIAIPKSVGALMVAGYNNWDRIYMYKQAWLQKQPFGNWNEAFKQFVANKELYQDRFIILSDGPYSGVAAADMQLTEKKWRELSLTIRREHEVTHYFTQRLLGSMRNNMLDELIADYIGIVSSIGEYRADWFLTFIGLEHFPLCREDGRIHTYRSTLSDGAFYILQKLLVKAAKNLESLNEYVQGKPFTNKEKANAIRILANFTLEQLASEQGLSQLHNEFK